MTRGVTEGGERFIRVAAAVRQQRGLLARIVAEAAEALADFPAAEPPLRELRGIGAIIHDFYTGIEHVFERLAPELNGGLPAGSAWHRDLRARAQAPKGHSDHKTLRQRRRDRSRPIRRA